MKKYNLMSQLNLIRQGVMFCLLFILWMGHAYAQQVSVMTTEPFYPSIEAIDQLENQWGYMSVPENWEKPESNTIKVAYVVLKNWSNKKDAEAVVFVQGGPGASGIQNIGSWVWHPLRENNDIILMDIRGTGFSEPRLCPDLGEDFLKIFAKNQSKEEDVKQKVAAALSCKQNLLMENIDIDAYHSISVAKDLHALKNQLSYNSWTVYGVSYGTYMAQVYASNFPSDIENLILDSSIDAISEYYVKNTSNYLESLQKVFSACESDPDCNQQYPNLEQQYYHTIASLDKTPLTVKVDKSILDTGEFTYNSEDFKIAVQQALYKKKLIEVVPLLIDQFNRRNKEALGSLVAAFSGLLSMDYGVYFCVSCNETLPNNELASYEQDAQQFKSKGLLGGVSFYESDFDVCKKWNSHQQDSLPMFNDISNLIELSSPVLVFSGGFDPITPASNGKRMVDKFKNVQLVTIHSYGHVPSFTETGKELTASFLEQPTNKLDLASVQEMKGLNFAQDIALNKGVSKLGKSLNRLDPMFLAPLAIALLLMISFTLVYLVKLIRRRYTLISDKVVRSMSILMSFAGITGLAGLIFALLKISGKNYYILAFGLPDNYNYLFTIVMIFMVLLGLTLVYFLYKIRSINDRSVVFSFIFSNMLVATYLLYWGIV